MNVTQTDKLNASEIVSMNSSKKVVKDRQYFTDLKKETNQMQNMFMQAYNGFEIN